MLHKTRSSPEGLVFKDIQLLNFSQVDPKMRDQLLTIMDLEVKVEWLNGQDSKPLVLTISNILN